MVKVMPDRRRDDSSLVMFSTIDFIDFTMDEMSS